MTGQDGFELVVFDCDGVLVDSEVIAIRVDQRVLADLGWELELDEIVERFVGKSEAHFVAAIEQQLGVRLADGWDRTTGAGARRRLTRPRSASTASRRPWTGCPCRTVSPPAAATKNAPDPGQDRAAAPLPGPHLQRHGGRQRQTAPDLFLHAAASLEHRGRAVRRRRGQCLRRPGRPGRPECTSSRMRGCHPGRAPGRSRDHRLFRHAAAPRAHRGRAAPAQPGPSTA